jgi:hypothetical protein
MDLGSRVRTNNELVSASGVPHFVCHSGLDPESSVSELDSRFRGSDGFGNKAKKC